MRYLITFACYGQRLHGDASGSVDPKHNQYGSRTLELNAPRALAEVRVMTQEPYVLSSVGGQVVIDAVRQVCLQRGWGLLAAHARTTHVHVVVEADARPEKVMSNFKSYASRALNFAGEDGPDRKRWARHGSTRWLWSDHDVHEAIRYVVEQQGAPMSFYC